MVGHIFLTTPRSICSALLTPTCSLPCRYSLSLSLSLFPIPGSTLPFSLWLFPVVKFLQIEACLLQRIRRRLCRPVRRIQRRVLALCHFHIATQTAPKLQPSSIPGVGRRLRGVENAERSLSHSRYLCSALLRFDCLLTLFITGGFRTLAFWRSLFQEVHRLRYCRAAFQVNCPS